jgi:nucleotide-binding universal stress UspA family protein
MTKTIIVPLDGSRFAERALAPARTLARQTDASIVLLMSRLGGDPEPDAYFQSVSERAGIAAPRVVVIPDRLAATAIPMVAGTEPDPLICMSTRGHSGPGVALFGSVAEEVLRRIDVPAVFVGPSATGASDQDFEQLVVCLDGSETADAVVPVASSLARDIDADLWLVRVAGSDGRLDVPSTLEVETLEAAPLERIARVLNNADINVSWEILHGANPATAIVEFAKSLSSPLIAMTTHGRTGFARVVAGSVTMSVVHQAPCPVFVVRSQGLRI